MAYTQRVSHYSLAAETHSHRVQFAGTDSVQETLCCVTLSLQQYIQPEMYHLLAKQWTGGWAKNVQVAWLVWQLSIWRLETPT